MRAKVLCSGTRVYIYRESSAIDTFVEKRGLEGNFSFFLVFGFLSDLAGSSFFSFSGGGGGGST